MLSKSKFAWFSVNDFHKIWQYAVPTAPRMSINWKKMRDWLRKAQRVKYCSTGKFYSMRFSFRTVLLQIQGYVVRLYSMFKNLFWVANLKIRSHSFSTVKYVTVLLLYLYDKPSQQEILTEGTQHSGNTQARLNQRFIKLGFISLYHTSFPGFNFDCIINSSIQNHRKWWEVYARLPPPNLEWSEIVNN